MNYLQIMHPAISIFWSLIVPGLGQIIIRNMIPGICLLVGFIGTVYQSNIMTAYYYTSIGQFQLASTVLNKEWLLFIPSIYGYAVCSCYYHSIHINKLFKIEQARFLHKYYFHKNFEMPL